MDERTKGLVKQLLGAMSFDFEVTIAVRDWYPYGEQQLFRVVTVGEGGKRDVHYIGLPASFQFEFEESGSPDAQASRRLDAYGGE